MTWMCRLTWIYTVHTCHNGLYMEERVKNKYCQNFLHLCAYVSLTLVSTDWMS
jgi:hypothetical protein